MKEERYPYAHPAISALTDEAFRRRPLPAFVYRVFREREGGTGDGVRGLRRRSFPGEADPSDGAAWPTFWEEIPFLRPPSSCSQQ